MADLMAAPWVEHWVEPKAVCLVDLSEQNLVVLWADSKAGLMAPSLVDPKAES